MESSKKIQKKVSAVTKSFLPTIERKSTRVRSSSNILCSEKNLEFPSKEFLRKPKTQLKSAFTILNNFEIKELKLSPTLYLSEFENSLLESCQQKYQKLLKELNEVRSIFPNKTLFSLLISFKRKS